MQSELVIRLKSTLGFCVTGQAPSDAPHQVRERYGIAFGIVAAVIWGAYLAVSRHGISVGLTAADLAFLRYTTAGVLLFPWLLRNGPISLGGIGWLKGGLLAILAGPLFVLVGASGFLFAPLAHSAVIQLGTLTLMGIVLSAIIIGERPGARRILGIAVIVIGLSATAGPAMLLGGSTAWKGDLLFACAGTMWALFTVLQRRWQIAPIAATAVVSVLSALFYAPAYLLMFGFAKLLSAGPVTLAQQVIVLGLLSGVVALFAFARAVEYLGPGRASFFPAAAPAIAILLGIPISGEIPNIWQIVGLLLLTAGLLLALQGSGGRTALRTAS
jgi:drug/metabolite transporter (DMT)-like permease